MPKIRIVIGNRELVHFERVSVALKYDSVYSSFAFSATYLNNSEQRNIFRPLRYQQVKIYVGNINDDNLILTGTILKTEISSKAEPEGIKVSGYSLPGILSDCQFSPSNYPLQDDNKTLKEITQKFISPFGIELFVNQIAIQDANRTIEQTSASETQDVASYIVKLASQFNIVVGHTRRGRLLFTRVRANERARSNYVEGTGDFIEASLSVDGQAIHSDYTVLKQPDYLDNSAVNPQESVSNNIVPIFRQKVKKQTVGNSGNTMNAAINSRMEGLRAIKINLRVNSLLYHDQSIIKPNRVVTLQAPSIYLDQKISIFVDEVTLNQSTKGETAELKCFLREAFTGQAVRNIF